VFRDCVASTVYGAYQDITEVVELQCKVGGTREVQKYTDGEDWLVDTALVVRTPEGEVGGYDEEDGVAP